MFYVGSNVIPIQFNGIQIFIYFISTQPVDVHLHCTHTPNPSVIHLRLLNLLLVFQCMSSICTALGQTWWLTTLLIIICNLTYHPPGLTKSQLKYFRKFIILIGLASKSTIHILYLSCTNSTLSPCCILSYTSRYG